MMKAVRSTQPHEDLIESPQKKSMWTLLPPLLVLALFISASFFAEPAQIKILQYAFQARAVRLVEEVRHGDRVGDNRAFPLRLGWTPQPQSDTVQQDRIPGTSLRGSNEVAAFQSSLRCMAEEGYWFLNTTPRWHGYGRMLAGAVTNCDAYFAATTPGATVGEDAEEARMSGKEWKVREAVMYQWQMKRGATCEYRQFDRTEFCHLLQKRPNIVVVGDSLSTHFGMTFIEHIIPVRTSSGAKKEPKAKWDSHGFLCGHGDCLPLHGCQDVVGNTSIELRIARNDHLWTNSTEWLPRYSPWLSLLDRWQPSLLILNRGAHYTPDDVFGAEVESVIASIRERFPDLLIVWRSTPPGHKLERDPPELVLETRQSDMARPPQDNIPLPFHWADFQRQNGIARRIMDKYGVVFMDVDPMMSLRADGHIPHFVEPGPEEGKYEIRNMDGLHYCVPGPIDAWMTMLYNILLRADPSQKYTH